MKLYTRILSRIHPFTLGTVKDENLSKKIFLKLMKIAWKVLTLLNDNPIIVTYLLHGKSFYINAKHALPKMKLKWPYYDTSLTEIARFIECNLGYVTAIDIGANIGDTALNLRMGCSGKILCIEPSKNFYEILCMNSATIEPIDKLNIFIGESGLVASSLDETKSGTAIATSSSESKVIDTATKTIDEIIKLYPDYKDTNLIKIDTDGWDFSVLRSAKSLIHKAKPFIFFEYMPELILKYGNEEPLGIIEILKDLEYYDVILYDGWGYIYGKIDLRNEDEYLSFLKLFTQCVSNYSPYWLDFLTCHISDRSHLENFYKKEMRRLNYY